MAVRRKTKAATREARPPTPVAAAAAPPPAPEGDLLPMIDSSPTFEAAIAPSQPRPPPEPRRVPVGVVVFDMDGTLIDSIGLISHVAADVLFRAFGTPPEEGRLHYLATTGMPFEAQLAQLFPEVPPEERSQTARLFHHRKIQEAYAHAGPFPEITGILRKLSRVGWTLVISTGAEGEMAELILERDGLRYWFEDVLGSGEGTKREHLREYQRRYPGVPIFLVGDSRFDMEAAADTPGVRALGRASQLHGWALTPDDLKRWGAEWAEYTLTGLPEALTELTSPAPKKKGRRKRS